MNSRLTQQQEIERLFTKVKEYRKSDNFRQLLKFCADFKNLSPYNAWLAQLQRPGARYILSETVWRKQYGRVLRPNAIPIVILVPFGPIAMVFDIGDTMPDSSAFSKLFDNDEDLLKQLARPYRTRGNIENYMLEHIERNLLYYGVSVDKAFQASAGYGAKIEVYQNGGLHIPIKQSYIDFHSDYLVSINSKADAGELFASLCHELGHLFCHHLPSLYKAGTTRNLGHKEEEFEAETVAWLICERAGISNPSEHYLAGYTENGEIPDNISINAILLATGEIEHLMKDTPSEALKHGFLYKHSKDFKERLSHITQQQKTSKNDLFSNKEQ